MFARKIANLIMLPPRSPFEETEAEDSRDGFSQAFKDYHELWDRHPFKVKSDDVIINGEYVINPANTGERKKVAVICHGQRVSRAGGVKYAKMFYDLGYNLVLFDERYFGDSTAKYSTLGWREPDDIKQVIKYAREVFGEDCFLGMHGESLGAGSSLRALDTEKPDFVVADCPFADTGLLIDELADKLLGFLGPWTVKRAEKICAKRYPGYSFRNVRPKDSIKGTAVPICFMHGAEDGLINPRHSQMMFDTCKNPLSEIHFFEKTDHARSVFNEPVKYEQLLTAFVKKVEVSNNI